MVRIEFTKNAINDLKEIKDFISKDSKFYAEKHILKILETISLLEQNIKLGRKVPEFGLDNIREIIKFNYRIVYQIIKGDYLRILTIHHSSKMFPINLIQN